MEFEFVTLDLVNREVEWLRGLLANVPLWGMLASLIFLHCHNQTLFVVVTNSVYDGKRICIHLIHDVVSH